MTRLMHSICLALGFLMFGGLALAQSPEYSSGADAPNDYNQTPPEEAADAAGSTNFSGSFFDRSFSKKDSGKSPSKAGIFTRKAGKAITGLVFGNPVKKLVPKDSLAKANKLNISVLELFLIILLILLVLALLRALDIFGLLELIVTALVIILLVLIILWILGEL